MQKINECCKQTLEKIEISNWKRILLKVHNTLKKIVLKMHHNWKTRNQLSHLTEAQLKDIGLTKCDVYEEVQKPIWK